MSDKPSSPLAVGLIIAVVTMAYFVPRLVKSWNISDMSGGSDSQTTKLIQLPESTLNPELENWQLVDFSPPSESVYRKSGAWTHSWSITKKNASAIVSFDQLGLRGWHELTECYTAIGWTVTERIPSRSDAANNWQYIVARLQRDTQRATLVYSIFDGAGNPMQTPDDSPSWLEQRQVWGNDTLRETMRTLQAQVLIAHAGDLPEELEQEIIQLHLVTRDRFKSEWLAKSNTIASSTEQL